MNWIDEVRWTLRWYADRDNYTTRILNDCGGKARRTLAAIPDEPEADYKRAKGIIPWQEGDELPEETIARIRGRGEPEMMKLLRWLEAAVRAERDKPSTGSFWATITLNQAIKYIEREFGYKLEHE